VERSSTDVAVEPELEPSADVVERSSTDVAVEPELEPSADVVERSSTDVAVEPELDDGCSWALLRGSPRTNMHSLGT